MGKLKVFEAFAGVGAQRMALRNLGIDFEVVGICEIDKFALKSYKAIHGECNNFGDISKVNPNELPDMDLFTYSFPCQDLSIAGKREGLKEGTRSGLLYECEKIIEAKKPKYLLLENVKNLVGKKFKPDFDKWLNYLEGLGYKNYWKVLNAKDYGVPQNRERVFVVSILGEHKPYTFPQPIKLNRAIKDILEPHVDEKYYMNKPFKLVDKGNVKAEFTDRNFEQGKRIYGTDSYFQCLGAADRGINNILISAYLTDFGYKQTSKVLNKEGIAATLDTMQGGHREPKILEEGYRVRKLTPLECWRLMSFADEDFYKAKNAGISNSQLYKQAGNSIVVKVLEGIFKNLLIDNEQVKEITTEKDNYVFEKYQKPTNEIVMSKVVQMVEVRKYEVDVDKLKVELKKAKEKSKLSIMDIANTLDVKKTTVEHWFRNDNCFSIPSREIWNDLKTLLNIRTNEFDKSITEFELKENEYDISNRVYHINGVSPTLTCDTEATAKKILMPQVKEITTEEEKRKDRNIQIKWCI